MTVTFKDELGVISVSIDKGFGVHFGTDKAYFTDEDGKDYKVKIEYIISITAE